MGKEILNDYHSRVKHWKMEKQASKTPGEFGVKKLIAPGKIISYEQQ